MAEMAQRFTEEKGDSRADVSTASGQSVQAISRKKGRAKIGLWAVRQRDRMATFGRLSNVLNPVFRIDIPLATSNAHLPFQPWNGSSFFWELFPNGVPLLSSTVTDVCSYNNPSAAGWNRSRFHFRNTSSPNQQDINDTPLAPHGLPRNYTEDELEWPYINILDCDLKLVCHPGVRASTCRLLVIQLFPNEVAEQRDINTFTLNEFVNAGVVDPINMPFISRSPLKATGWSWKILADKTWVTTPGDTSTRQVPYFMEVKQRHGNVELVNPDTASFGSEAMTHLGKSRIIWQLFYQDTDTDPTDPSITEATSNMNSYYGWMKFKWKLVDR